MNNCISKFFPKFISAISSIIGFIVLPNLVFILIALWLSVGRPYFNVDYAFAMLLMLVGQRLLGGLSFLALALVDVLSIVSQIFPLPRLQDAFYLLSVAHLASNMFVVLIFVSGALLVFNVIFSLFLVSRVERLYSLIAFNVLIVLYAVHVHTYQGSFNRFYRVSESVLVSSQLKDFSDRRDTPFLWRFNDEAEPLVAATYEGATKSWFSSSLEGKVLLIVNESWGVSVNPDIRLELLKPMAGISVEDKITGEISFSGATVGAELRELCQREQNNLNLSNVLVGFEDCLPNKLKASGYTTAAMHGAVSLMYDRKDWYPRAGLDQLTFFETKVWPRRCYSFPGACDLDLMQELPAFFERPGKRFLYWLTLNSHSLYDKRDILKDVFDCSAFKIDPDSESCRNLKLQAQFFDGLAEVLKRPEMRGVRVMIVGDHPPVIFNQAEKAANFVPGRVPWISFKVAETANP